VFGRSTPGRMQPRSLAINCADTTAHPRRPCHPILRCCYGAVGARATVHGVRRSPKPQVSMGM
jgi:hypothetical protein